MKTTELETEKALQLKADIKAAEDKIALYDTKDNKTKPAKPENKAYTTANEAILKEQRTAEAELKERYNTNAISQADYEREMEDITIRRAANYAVLGYALEDAVFRGMHIAEGWDGIHIRGAQRVSISNCRFETGDDAIAGGYWEEMTIAHCDINSACNGVRIIMPCQGVDIGHCRLHGPGTYAHRTSGKQQRRNMLFGISLEPGGWGSAPGDMRGIRLHDLTMDRLSAPVSVSIRKECHAHDLTLENITATHVEGAMSATVCWNDTGFDRITVNNVNLSRNNP